MLTLDKLTFVDGEPIQVMVAFNPSTREVEINWELVHITANDRDNRNFPFANILLAARRSGMS